MSRFLLFLFFFLFQKPLSSKKRRSLVGFGWYSGATEMADGEGEEERRTLANLGRNRECQGRNSLRLVFVFAAFYRSRRSYTPAILKRKTPISSPIPLPQFHARPKIFRRFRRTRILPLPLLFLPKSKAEEKFLDSP